MEQIRQYIRQGQLHEAIDCLVQLAMASGDTLRTDGLALDDRYMAIRRQRLTGELTADQVRQAEQLLCLDVLRWVTAYEKWTQAPEPPAPPPVISEPLPTPELPATSVEEVIPLAEPEYSTESDPASSATAQANCPNCKKPFDVAPESFSESGYNEVTCKHCQHRFFELDWLFHQPAAYKHLTEQEAWQLEHAMRAIESDLRLNHFKRAWERAEDQKTKFAKTALIHEVCALTFFFAHSLEEVHLRESARRILIYLDDSKRADPLSPTYAAYAQAIALRYFAAVKRHLNQIRQFQPVLPQTPPGQPPPDMRIEVLQQRVHYRRQMLRVLRELDTCYKIWPYRSFLYQGLKELHGHNGTSWLQLQFARWGGRPPMLQNSLIIDGFWWDYYYLIDNMRPLLAPDELSALDVRANMLSEWEKTVTDVPAPTLLVGAPGAAPQSPHPELVRNGWKYFATMLSVLFFPYILYRLAGWLAGLLLAVVLCMIILPRWEEIKGRFRRFWRATWAKPTI